MNSAIVVGPGRVKGDDQSVFVVVSIPTIEVAISYVPERLKELNIFQKGVSYFLLAGLTKADQIAQAMGVTDKDFVGLILSELTIANYVDEFQIGEFKPSRKLLKEFSDPLKYKETLTYQLIAFVPIGNGARKILGPLDLPVTTSEIDITVTPMRVAVGTEGNPLEVNCLYSDLEREELKKVDRSTAKQWIVGSSTDNRRSQDSQTSTKVEIVNTQRRHFVLQCFFREHHKNAPVSKRPDQLQRILNVRFAGESRKSDELVSLLADIATADIEFWQKLHLALCQTAEVIEKKIPTKIVEGKEVSQLENIEQQNVTKVNLDQGRQTNRPLKWLVRLLAQRLGDLEVSRLEELMVSNSSIQRQVNGRINTFTIETYELPIPPLPRLQLESIAGGQAHEDLDVCPILAIWFLLEENEVLSDLFVLNSDFALGIRDIFLNPHTEVGKNLRETFESIYLANS